tara:strand:- start:12 stop:224 length:213 start_codon:yes stop_codon:yes gene_type:complete
MIKNGAKRTRTADHLHAMQVLYQLSYGPNRLRRHYNNSLKDPYKSFKLVFSNQNKSSQGCANLQKDQTQK